MMNQTGTYTALLDFLESLDAAGIYHELSHHTGRAIMVHVVRAGERWEIEFQEDGEIDVEIFRTIGMRHSPEILEELLRSYGSEPAIGEDATDSPQDR